MKPSSFTGVSFSGRIVSGLLPLLLLFTVKVYGQGLPSAPKKLIETSIENWNAFYGTTVKAINWSYEGVINNQVKLNQAFAEITSLQDAWFPSGDVGRPVEMTALRISDDPSITNTEIANWKVKIQGMVKTGQHIVRLNWNKAGVAFTSVCITDDTSIVYDNMLSNAVLASHNSVCLDLRYGFIWQKHADRTMGAIKAELFIKCPPPPICDHQCDAFMKFGEAKINCKVETIGNCCKLSWSYGWATGFKKVKLKVGKFGIEIEGRIGSSGKGDGSCTECCAQVHIGMINPVAPIQTAGGSVGTEGPQQLRTISVSTLTGEVVDIKVPNNIRPGDHITGSIVPKTQSSTLQGAVVDVQDNKSNVKDRLFKFVVPAGLASMPLIIRDPNGAELIRTAIPINSPNLPTPGNNVTIPTRQIELPTQRSPGNFAPMNYCQPGQALTINGFFDGNASNTNVSLNNIPCEIIAESDRASFVNVPPNLPAGRASLSIEEGGVTQTIPIQVITTNLTSDKTVIQKNRKATVTATVSGLENLDLNNNNFNIELTNNSPSVIQFRDANTTTITRDINSSNVKNGVFRFTVDITGISTGPYTINSNISSTTCNECWKQYENCVAQMEADEKQCYKDCDKNNGGVSCYLACSAAARLQEAECFAQYLGCVRKKMGF